MLGFVRPLGWVLRSGKGQTGIYGGELVGAWAWYARSGWVAHAFAVWGPVSATQIAMVSRLADLGPLSGLGSTNMQMGPPKDTGGH